MKQYNTVLDCLPSLKEKEVQKKYNQLRKSLRLETKKPVMIKITKHFCNGWLMPINSWAITLVGSVSLTLRSLKTWNILKQLSLNVLFMVISNPSLSCLWVYLFSLSLLWETSKNSIHLSRQALSLLRKPKWNMKWMKTLYPFTFS